MPKGGARVGAGRRPIVGTVRDLIQQAADILYESSDHVAQSKAESPLTAAVLGTIAQAVAADGMRASRRLERAAELLSDHRDGDPRDIAPCKT
jgi:hypothetical protein